MAVQHKHQDVVTAHRLLALVPKVPIRTWGRTLPRTGDMWNSNSVISWLLTTAGIDASALHPPAGGRAPGWAAGVALAKSGQA